VSAVKNTSSLILNRLAGTGYRKGLTRTWRRQDPLVPSFGLTHPGVLLLRNRDTGLGHLAGSPFMQTVRMRNCGQIELRILSIWWRCSGTRLTWNGHGEEGS